MADSKSIDTSFEISPLDNRQWIPQPIPNWIVKELTRRRNDFGINYKKNSDAGSANWDVDGNWNEYRGPMSPWVRLCSNGDGQKKQKSPNLSSQKPSDGFVMYGGQGFKDTFGLEDNKTVLGYDVNGNPHIIPMDNAGMHNYTVQGNDSNNRTVPMYLPTPGITSIEAIVQKQLIRSVTVKWNCFGYAQLEYLTPYFLTPGISMIVEFGWNHFNKNSLLNLREDGSQKYEILDRAGNKSNYKYRTKNGTGKIEEIENLGLRELWKDGRPLYDYNTRISNGMYDVTFGLITNFEFSTQDGIKWDCTTTIGSKHRNYGGVQFSSQNTDETKNDSDRSEGNTNNQAMTFQDFVDKRLKKVKDYAVDNRNFLFELDEKEKKLTPTDKKFYNGWSENRVFFGRGDQNYFGSENKARKSNWDYNGHDKVWVTMGFLIELFNYFFTKPSALVDKKDDTFQFYEINAKKKTPIGAHPNLISCDGDVLLIPNPVAPKFNYSTRFKSDTDGKLIVDGFDGQVLNVDKRVYAKSFTPITPLKTKTKKTALDYADIKFEKIFRTANAMGSVGVARDNLDGILNRLRYDPYEIAESQDRNSAPLERRGSLSFPQLDSSKLLGKPEFCWGYLEDLYINVNHVIKLVKETKNTEQFYEKLLDSLNAASAGFWDLKIVEEHDVLTIVDQKFISYELFKREKVYQFDVSGGNNIIKNLNFTSTLSAAQANQVVASSRNNQGGGENSTTSPLDFLYGDRLFKDEGKMAKRQTFPNTEVISQLQKYGDNEAAYIMTFMAGDIKNVVNLTLPNSALLTTVLNDENFYDNTNVYGGQQPNFTLEFTIQGIAGLRTFQCFSFKHFPKPYSDEEVIFQIVDVVHTITDKNWETRIKASIRPFRANVILPTYTDGSDV